MIVRVTVMECSEMQYVPWKVCRNFPHLVMMKLKTTDLAPKVER